MTTNVLPSSPVTSNPAITTLAASNFGLPEGVFLTHAMAILLIVGTITVALRALPFAAIAPLRSSSFIAYLGMTMPVGVMSVLSVYALSASEEEPGGMIAGLIAVAATIALHLWRKSAALSIFGGTIFYMVLVNVVF